jgi:hypothetical protein
MMPIGTVMIATNSGTIWQLIRREEGKSIFKQLSKDTPYDKDKAYYCFDSMLKPEPQNA